MTTEPITVQLGLEYIKEEDGPTTELPCSIKIIPRIAGIMPATISDLPTFFLMNTPTHVVMFS